VNQPEVSYSSTMAGLWGYWLAPVLVALLLAAGLPLLGPVSRRWGGELFLLHLAFASAVLGLGWAPHLGLGDGPARGLDRFFGVSPLLYVGVCALVGALTAPLSMLRLAGNLWHVPYSLTRPRRLLLVTVHGVVPAAFWIAMARLLGWRVAREGVLTAGLVLAGALLAVWIWLPGAAIVRRDRPGVASLVVAGMLGLAVSSFSLWMGAPNGGSPRGVLWAKPSETNNIRVEWKIVAWRSGLLRPHQAERGYVP
jgi:hypothetical protein